MSSSFISELEENPWFRGLFILIGTLGIVHIKEEFNHKVYSKYMSCPIMCKVIFFAIIFTATRNLLVSGIITLVYYIIIDMDKHGEEDEDAKDKKQIDDSKLII